MVHSSFLRNGRVAGKGAFMWWGWILKGAGLKSKSAAAACHLDRWGCLKRNGLPETKSLPVANVTPCDTM